MSPPVKAEESHLNLDRILGAVEVLSETEKSELLACEAAITMGWRSFVDVGLSLARIRDAHLYRAEFDTFDAYCRSRWEYGRHYVFRLISAAQVYTLLLTNCQHRPPQSEAQLRPLAGLTAEQAQLAWQTAVEKSRGGRVTARLVQSAVQAQQVSSGKPLVASQPRPSPGERLRLAQGAIGELLVLISQKASYETLTEKVEALHHQIQALFTRTTRC